MQDVTASIGPIATMLDSLGVAVCLLDPQDRAILWNGTFLRFFPEHDGHIRTGEPYVENLRRFYLSRLDEAEREHIDRYIADGLARHRSQQQPFEFAHRGRWLRVASLAMPRVGRMRIWTPVASPRDTDVMARGMAAAGKALDGGQIDDIPDGLMILDASGRISFVNRRFAAMYGLARESDATGRTFADVLAQVWDGRDGAREALLTLASHQDLIGAPYELPLPGDQWVRISEHRAVNGDCVVTHACITDLRRLQRATEAARAEAEALAASLHEQIEERRRAEEALRQIQRVEAVGQLTAGVAHDFNNLFAIMMANLELLDAPLVEPRLRRRLDVLRSSVERGAALTGQLLAFARRQPLMPRPVVLSEMVAAMVPLLGAACGRRVEIITSVPGDLPSVLVDPTQLELVILNLALNARDAMPGGGRLCIAGEVETLGEPDDPDAPEAGKYVVLRVIDDGIGMTEAVRTRATEPYFTTKGPGQGSGLGLSQAFGLARQSGGTVRIASQLGKGTTVSVLLPAVDALAVDVPRTAVPVVQPAKPRVLVVDDDPAVLEGVAELLEIIGYEVTAVPGSTQAAQLVEGGLEVDALVTDVIMPGMTGPDLARLVWERRPDMPVLFISGFAAPETIEGLGGNCILLRKPCRLADLRGALSALLGTRETVAVLG
jgi:signal transduction histidine kinase/CheY-like chemotaxis protein